MNKPPLYTDAAYSIDYRGDNDDQLTFVFLGADTDVIKAVFRWLIAGGNIAKGFLLKDEHACVWRNGKHFWRVSAQIDSPNYEFASLDDMCLLIESRLRAIGYQRIVRINDYNKFLNI